MTAQEELAIVDEHDKLISTKAREAIQPSDIYRVAALWLTNPAGDVLLAQRKWTKKHDPGKWGPAVAGTVNSSETYGTNIYKEAQEEIGLAGAPFARGPKYFSDGEHRHFTQWFLATCNWPVEHFIIQEVELERLAWFPRKQLVSQLQQSPDLFIPTAQAWLRLFLA